MKTRLLYIFFLIVTLVLITELAHADIDPTRVQKLLAIDDYFGDSVSVSGDTAVIGDRWDYRYYGNYHDSGVACIYGSGSSGGSFLPAVNWLLLRK